MRAIIALFVFLFVSLSLSVSVSHAAPSAQEICTAYDFDTYEMCDLQGSPATEVACRTFYRDNEYLFLILAKGCEGWKSSKVKKAYKELRARYISLFQQMEEDYLRFCKHNQQDRICSDTHMGAKEYCGRDGCYIDREFGRSDWHNRVFKTFRERANLK